MKPISSHQDMEVWQKAISLAGKVYAATRRLPAEERDGLTLQLRRVAVSIPTTIADGVTRVRRRESLGSLHNVRGLLSELETQLMIAVDQGFLDDDREILGDISEMRVRLNELTRAITYFEREAHAASCSPNTTLSVTSAVTGGHRPHPHQTRT